MSPPGWKIPWQWQKWKKWHPIWRFGIKHIQTNSIFNGDIIFIWHTILLWTVWMWVFITALAWATYFSSRFWKPFTKRFVHYVSRKNCMKMTWSSSPNHWKKGDPCGMCLKGASTNSIFCGGCSVGSTRNATISLAVWSLILAFERFTGKVRPVDGRQRSQWVGRSLKWCHPSVTSGTTYPRVAVVTSFPSQHAVLHGQIQWAPARPHLQLIPQHLHRKSLQPVRQERHASCKRQLDSNLLWFVSPATQWPS